MAVPCKMAVLGGASSLFRYLNMLLKAKLQHTKFLLLRKRPCLQPKISHGDDVFSGVIVSQGFYIFFLNSHLNSQHE